MAVLDLVDYRDPILHNPLPLFNFKNPPTDPIQLAKDLAETMIHNKGLGIAANQIGLPYRAFALTGEQILVCFNPKIVSVFEETVLLEESCLSYNGLLVKIRRPKTIRVRFTMPNGHTRTETFSGITARCFQHELDHLDGVSHITRAHPIHREKAKRDWKSYNRRLKSA